MFGSSANSFGLDSSDVDVCCLWKFPDGKLAPSPIPPVELVRIAATVAEETGMTDVRSLFQVHVVVQERMIPSCGDVFSVDTGVCA